MKQLKRKFDTVVWANEYSNCTGEGILAQNFLKDYFSIYKKDIIKIITLDKKFIISNKTKNTNFKNKNSFYHKYISFIFGIFYLWKYSKKKIIYLNYLPLWNFLIFLFLPKKAILGPITGGVVTNNYKSFFNIIRNIFFPLFYRISLFIIFIKYNKFLFSTNLLKKYIKKKNKNYLFSYVYTFFKKKKFLLKKKKFDIIFYNRNYSSKETNLIKNIIFKLSNKTKICVIGEQLFKNGVKNFGYVSRQKALYLISRSKFSFASGENILSIFAIDSYNCNTKLFYNYDTLKDNRIDKKNFIPIFFNNEKKTIKIISNNLNLYKFHQNKKFNNFLFKKKKEVKIFLKNYF
jgi:hypothetical protein